jgi:hypothetical protein
VDFEVVYVNLRAGEHKEPAFMSMQVRRETYWILLESKT